MKVKLGAIREASQLFEQAQEDIRYLSHGPEGLDKARYFSCA